MSHEFATQMECAADDLARDFKTRIDGVKPWYSYAGLFDGHAARVFVGLNPGGSSQSMKLDKKYRKAVYEDPLHCSWLDEPWERNAQGGPGKGPHQKRVRKAFKAMYGKDWEDVLRSTPCFNVVPFRTSSGAELPPGVWEVAQPWFRKVLRHLRPRLIICNGSGETRPHPRDPSRRVGSAWSALKEFNTVKSPKRIRTADKGWIKYGEVISGPMEGTYVVALPHLSWEKFWPSDRQFRMLRKLRDSRPDLFV